MKKAIALILSVFVITSIAYALSPAAKKNSSPISNIINSIQQKISAKNTNIKVPNNTVDYYFPRANQEPKPALEKVIKSAKKTLDVAIYSFTDTGIANAIISDKERGVKVQIITDRTCSLNLMQKRVLRMLKSAGIAIKINQHVGLMHLKMTVADSKVLTTGSFNYTRSAEFNNDEVLVVLHNIEMAKGFDREFNQMWADTRNFTNY